MPEVSQQPDPGPLAHSGQKGVHQSDAVHFVRILGGIGIGDHQSNIVADDYLLVAQRSDQRVDVLAIVSLS